MVIIDMKDFHPKQIYQQQISQQLLKPNEAQALIVDKLDEMFWQLNGRHQKNWGLLRRKFQPHTHIGLYLYGDVGTGKTMLMDLFFQSLPFENKLRAHFHQFMRSVHQQLFQLQGKRNPLEIVAKQFAKTTRVICLDEFMVDDIGDAMILAGLIQAIFKQKICLLTTSNLAPDDLYKNGLQRQNFLPAIELIKNNLTVLKLNDHTDYRKIYQAQATHYFTPLHAKSLEKLAHAFKKLHQNQPTSSEPIFINHRDIPVINRSKNAIWFDFDVICQPGRCQNDYLDLCQTYQYFFISNVKIIPPNQHDKIRLFIKLIDILYDNHCQVYLQAQTPPAGLYPAGKLQFEYLRSVSRLSEMQSMHYSQFTHAKIQALTASTP